MSIQAINQYHNDVAKNKAFTGKNHEQTNKDFFKRLINHYAEKRHLWIASEISIQNKQGRLIRPDGIVKNNLTLNCGYWESKANVDLEKEIILKSMRVIL
jgi:predicted nuclease of restriction endonuclease-like (RecB) superfamily